MATTKMASQALRILSSHGFFFFFSLRRCRRSSVGRKRGASHLCELMALHIRMAPRPKRQQQPCVLIPPGGSHWRLCATRRRCRITPVLKHLHIYSRHAAREPRFQAKPPR